MWISERMAKSQQTQQMQTGTSTLNDKGKVEAVSTGAERNIKMFAPYGYCFSLPKGMEIMLANGDGQQSAVGVLMEVNDIESGEIKITSLSGAYIHLKNDGSVVINGLEINRNGVVADDI